MPFSLIALLFLALPFVEIAGFVIVGSHIGVLPTLALVVLSGMLGLFLLRVQGFSLLQRIRTEIAAGRVPDREVVHGAMLVVAAILLIIPGFFTDILGLLLFIPPVRDLVWRYLIRSRVIVTMSTSGFGHGPQAPGEPRDRVIDLTPDDYERKPDRNSPWRGDRE
ncbi:membrane protein FxsA [Brucella endophytica]|uniref:Membrane protein FxsA n=1 Tax=Brucella endophytica TaxID=1963359 RepID=A0A916WEB1_9HYPH|nr:FxsA family protein [Brucella endophytica]GGA90552.1 membrane protein FxsA [Brucella endophytica]